MLEKLVLRFLTTAALIVLVDIYLYYRLRREPLFNKYQFIRKWGKYLHFGIAAFFTLLFFIIFSEVFTGIDMGLHGLLYQASSWMFLIYMPKFIITLCMLCEDVVSGLRWAFVHIFSRIRRMQAPLFVRYKYSNRPLLIVALALFFVILHAMLISKYNFQLRQVEVYSPDLPEGFDGFRIVQISDVHAGSFRSIKRLQQATRLVNEQQADILVFTGDMVNTHSREIEAFVPVFAQMQASEGKFSILGNHDYGDYYRWKSNDQKRDNFNLLLDYQKQMGFTLLNNEHRIIRRDDDSIALIGVENWGRPPFPDYGDLRRAMNGLPEGMFKVLLSHDPNHWKHEVLDKTNIQLTLSGHTHGMQMGLNLEKLGIKWSPAQYIYEHWGGLYQQNGQYLYVNTGFGVIGFQGRIGMPPEITLITLRRGG